MHIFQMHMEIRIPYAFNAEFHALHVHTKKGVESRCLDSLHVHMEMKM